MAATETVIDTITTRGGDTVQVVRLEGPDPGVIWRCTCGGGSDWPFTTDTSIDPTRLINGIARTHAILHQRP